MNNHVCSPFYEIKGKKICMEFNGQDVFDVHAYKKTPRTCRIEPKRTKKRDNAL